MKLFAAIDIGSYEVEMKIFQITSGKGIKEIDCVCHRMELGKDVYRTQVQSIWINGRYNQKKCHTKSQCPSKCIKILILVQQKINHRRRNINKP